MKSFFFINAALACIISALLGQDFLASTAKYKHHSMCAQMFTEEYARRLDLLSDDYDACIQAYDLPTLSEYEVQEKCFFALPSAEKSKLILEEVKTQLYIKQKCFNDDAKVLLQVDE